MKLQIRVDDDGIISDVKFKTFGFLPLTLLFALAQAPLIMRYESKDAPSDAL